FIHPLEPIVLDAGEQVVKGGTCEYLSDDRFFIYPAARSAPCSVEGELRRAGPERPDADGRSRPEGHAFKTNDTLGSQTFHLVVHAPVGPACRDRQRIDAVLTRAAMDEREKLLRFSGTGH